MNTNEMKDKVNKKLNEGVETIFDIFNEIFEGFQSNFDKVWKTEQSAEKTNESVDTTEIHEFKKFQDGKCVNEDTKVWKNGKLVYSDGAASTLDNKCTCNKECKCANNTETSVNSVNELLTKIKQMEKDIFALKETNKVLSNENHTLKDQLNKIKNIFK